VAKIEGTTHPGFAVKNLSEAIRSAEENLGGELMMKFKSFHILGFAGIPSNFHSGVVSAAWSISPKKIR